MKASVYENNKKNKYLECVSSNGWCLAMPGNECEGVDASRHCAHFSDDNPNIGYIESIFNMTAARKGKCPFWGGKCTNNPVECEAQHPCGSASPTVTSSGCAYQGTEEFHCRECGSLITGSPVIRPGHYGYEEPFCPSCADQEEKEVLP